MLCIQDILLWRNRIKEYPKWRKLFTKTGTSLSVTFLKMRQLHLPYQSVLIQSEQIWDHDKFVPYLLTEKQKQDSNLSWTSSRKTTRNSVIPFKITTDENPKTNTTIFSGRIHHLSTQRGPNMFYGVYGVVMHNTIASPTQQPSSPSHGITCSHKQGNDNWVRAV